MTIRPGDKVRCTVRGYYSFGMIGTVSDVSDVDGAVTYTVPESGDDFLCFPNELQVVERARDTPDAAPGGWREIETAPKDGTHILIARPNASFKEDRFHVVRWDDDWWQVHDGKNDHPLRGNDPVLWRALASPLPEDRAETALAASRAEVLEWKSILDKVLRETAKELGCEPDNEAILAAIAASRAQVDALVGALERVPCDPQMTDTKGCVESGQCRCSRGAALAHRSGSAKGGA